MICALDFDSWLCPCDKPLLIWRVVLLTSEGGFLPSPLNLQTADPAGRPFVTTGAGY